MLGRPLAAPQKRAGAASGRARPLLGINIRGSDLGVDFRTQIWGPRGPDLGAIQGMFFEAMGTDMGVMFYMVLEARNSAHLL